MRHQSSRLGEVRGSSDQLSTNLKRITIVLGLTALALVLSTHSARAQSASDWQLQFETGPPRLPAGAVVSTAGIDSAGEDSLYIGDTREHRVLVANRDTGEFITMWGSPGREEGRFDSPIDVAAEIGGTVVVLDSGNRRIQRFEAAGRFIASLPLDPRLADARTLAARPDGTLLIGTARSRTVAILSRSGRVLAMWRIEPNEPYRAGLHVAAAQDGSFAVADSMTSQIYRYSDRGQLLAVASVTPGPLGASPLLLDVDVGPDGTIWAVDGGGGRVLGFAPDGTRVATVVYGHQWPDDAPQFASVAVDHDAVRLVQPGRQIDIRSQRILPRGLLRAFGPDGSLLHEHHIGNTIPSDDSGFAFTGLGHPDVAPNGDVIVPTTSRMFRLSALGAHVDSFATVGPTAGIDVATDGTIFAADLIKPPLSRYGPGGEVLGRWPVEFYGFSESALLDVVADDDLVFALGGSTRWRMAHVLSRDGVRLDTWPVGLNPVAIDQGPDGSVFVADASRSNEPGSGVRVHTQDGAEMGGWLLSSGTATVGPADLSVTVDGEVLVADRYGEQVLSFDQTGDTLGQWRMSTEGDIKYPGQLSGLASAEDGTVFTVQSGGRLAAFARRQPVRQWRVEIFDNAWLSGLPREVAMHEAIDFDWGIDAPATRVPSDGFSLAATRSVDLAPGVYSWVVEAEGGVRLWVGNRLIVDAWDESSVDLKSSHLQSSFAREVVRLDFRDRMEEASLQLRRSREEIVSRIHLPALAN